MNIGLPRLSLCVAIAIFVMLGACKERAKTRQAPEYQTEKYFIQLASVVAEERRVDYGQPPADLAELLSLLDKRSSQETLVKRQFFDKNGADGLVYGFSSGRYWMYVKRPFEYHGKLSFLCADAEKGVHWLAAENEQVLLSQLQASGKDPSETK